MVSQEQGKSFFMHPVDTLRAMANQQGELGKRAGEELKNKDYVRGLTHAVEYLMPGLGPTLAHAGDQLESGDIAGGAGTTVGAAIPIAMSSPAVADAAANARIPVGQLPQKMYQSALKPSTTLPTNEVRNIVSTGLENKIPVSAAGAQKLNGLIGDLGDAVKQQIQSGSKAGATIDPAAVASRADALKGRFANQVNPDADLAAIRGSQEQFLKNHPNPIPAVDAQTMKQGTYAQLKDKSYGELSSATVEAQKALARGIKEELEKQFPEIGAMNAQQGKFFGLDDALDRAVKRIDNRNIFTLGGKVATAGGAAAGGAPGGMAAFILHHVITSPEVQSKLAITLNHLGKGGLPFPGGAARVAAYVSALGQSAGASQPSGIQPQQASTANSE